MELHLLARTSQSGIQAAIDFRLGCVEVNLRETTSINIDIPEKAHSCQESAPVRVSNLKAIGILEIEPTVYIILLVDRVPVSKIGSKVPVPELTACTETAGVRRRLATTYACCEAVLAFAGTVEGEGLRAEWEVI